MEAVTVLMLAHAAPGFDAVGLSPGLVLYLTAAGVALATLALRARPVTADPVEGEDRWPGDRPTASNPGAACASTRTVTASISSSAPGGGPAGGEPQEGG